MNKRDTWFEQLSHTHRRMQLADFIYPITVTWSTFQTCNEHQPLDALSQLENCAEVEQNWTFQECPSTFSLSSLLYLDSPHSLAKITVEAALTVAYQPCLQGGMSGARAGSLFADLSVLCLSSTPSKNRKHWNIWLTVSILIRDSNW